MISHSNIKLPISFVSIHALQREYWRGEPYFWDTHRTFPFFYIIIFKRWQFLEPSSSNPGGDRHMPSWHFCMQFNAQQLLFEAFFGYDPYFWQCYALKWIYFPLFVHDNISRMAIFEAPYLHSWGRRTYAPIDFFVCNLMPKNFYLTQFFIQDLSE